MANLKSKSCSVKLEADRDLCRGCLSSDRVLASWSDDVSLFMYLLGIQNMSYSFSDILLCWECLALLRNVQRFQTKIRQAQISLQRALYKSETSEFHSLSTLSSTQINNSALIIKHEDLNCQYDEKNELGFTYEIEKSEYIKQESDCPDDIGDEESSYNNEYYTLQDIGRNNEIEDDIKSENTEKKPYKKYGKQAKVTVNKDFDVNNIESYYCSVNVSNSEMEAVIADDVKGIKHRRSKCKRCRKAFKIPLDLKRHMTFEHTKQIEGPYKCLECATIVTTWLDLQTHWHEHNTVFQCGLCSARFRKVAEVKRHVEGHANVYTCCTCGVWFWTLKDFGKHYKELHKKLLCDDCGQTFLSKHSILKHIRRHHLPAKCRECNREYKSYHSLLTHHRMVHPELTYKTLKTELCYCVECDKQFPSMYKYKRHLATAVVHTPPVKISVPCPECGKVFSRKVYMNNHYKLVHSKKSTHHCAICDKYFATAYTARKHKEYVHDKMAAPKTKVCDICGRAFSTNRILTNHRRTHTGERPHKCAHCAAAFAQRVALAAHARSQHRRLQPR